MVLAMAEDLSVIFIKLADRLHNLRTIEYLGKQKQVQKAREALEVYAPLAHRLGIHQMKWELEDLASRRAPAQVHRDQAMVNERRADREEHVREARYVLQRGWTGRIRRHLRPREALLLITTRWQEGQGVHEISRPHRDARHRRAIPVRRELETATALWA